MGALQELFSQYSIEVIILIIFMVGLSIKGFSELWDWFKKQFFDNFSKESAQNQRHQEIMENLNDLQLRNSAMEARIETQLSQMDQRLTGVELRLEKSTARIQENTKSQLIDKHHHFCYNVKHISDADLEAIERRYLYYKSDGGDSYIDTLMDDIRSLPRKQNYDEGGE